MFKLVLGVLAFIASWTSSNTQSVCTCALNLYTGSTCKIKVKSFDDTLPETCESLDVVSLEIHQCTTNTLEVEFWANGDCSGNTELAHTFNLTDCVVVPEHSDLSFGVSLFIFLFLISHTTCC